MSVENNNNDEEQFPTIQSVPVNEELIEAVREAGGSNMIVLLLQQDPEDIPEVDKNSVRSEIQKYCYWEDEISTQAIEDKQHYGGDFFQAAWDGRVHDAEARADLNNTKILEELNFTTQ